MVIFQNVLNTMVWRAFWTII